MLPLERAMAEVFKSAALARDLKSGRIHCTTGNVRIIYGFNPQTGYEFAYAMPSNVAVPAFGPDEFAWPRITHYKERGLI